MSPVDRVENVHLLRHLPQLAHRVLPQVVDVCVDLGGEGGQHVVAVHHSGAGVILWPVSWLQQWEGDSSYDQVPQHHHTQPQHTEHCHGAPPAHVLTLVCAPRTGVVNTWPACLNITRVDQVLGGQHWGVQTWTEHCLLTWDHVIHSIVHHLSSLCHALLTRTVESWNIIQLLN